MKKLLSLSAACAVMLMFVSGAALAQDHDNDHGHDRDHHGQKHDNRYDHGHDHRGHDYRGNVYRGNDYRGNVYPGHGYGQVHYRNWQDRGRHEGWYHRGGYLPVEYRTRYVVTDWRRDRLREPPRGYRWVRSDNGDFLMVAITTGIITDLILNH